MPPTAGGSSVTASRSANVPLVVSRRYRASARCKAARTTSSGRTPSWRATRRATRSSSPDTRGAAFFPNHPAQVLTVVEDISYLSKTCWGARRPRTHGTRSCGLLLSGGRFQAARDPATGLQAVDAAGSRVREEPATVDPPPGHRVTDREHATVVHCELAEDLAVYGDTGPAVARRDRVFGLPVDIAAETLRRRWQRPVQRDRRLVVADREPGRAQLADQVLPEQVAGARVAGEGDDDLVDRVEPQVARRAVAGAVVPDPGPPAMPEDRQAEPPPVGEPERFGARHGPM